MDLIQARVSAYQLATQLNLLTGVNCPRCIAEMAKELEAYFLTGEIGQIKHWEDYQPQPAEGQGDLFDGNVIPLDPTKKH